MVCGRFDLDAPGVRQWSFHGGCRQRRNHDELQRDGPAASEFEHRDYSGQGVPESRAPTWNVCRRLYRRHWRFRSGGLRTYGRVTNPDGSQTWVVISTAASGDNSLVMLTTF